jgi:preprotein translocase subunit SecA
VRHVNESAILMVMEDAMPENENCQRLKLAPTVQARLAEIKSFEPVLEKLNDAELRRKTDELKDRLRLGSATANKS